LAEKAVWLAISDDRGLSSKAKCLPHPHSLTSFLVVVKELQVITGD